VAASWRKQGAALQPAAAKLVCSFFVFDRRISFIMFFVIIVSGHPHSPLIMICPMPLKFTHHDVPHATNTHPPAKATSRIS